MRVMATAMATAMAMTTTTRGEDDDGQQKGVSGWVRIIIGAGERMTAAVCGASGIQ